MYMHCGKRSAIQSKTGIELTKKIRKREERPKPQAESVQCFVLDSRATSLRALSCLWNIMVAERVRRYAGPVRWVVVVSKPSLPGVCEGTIWKD